MKKFARHAIFYAGLLAIWALLAKLKIWPPYVFPTPWGVLESLVAGFKDHRFWSQTGMGIRLALAHFRGNDLRQPGPWAVAHDGPRPERHEPGHRRDDSDHCDWLHRRRAGLQDHRTPTAAEVGIDPSHVESGC